jgi:hypothetical protein
MMIDPTEPKTATPQTTTSSGDPMSSIEAEIANLAARASDLQRTIGTWNDWYTAALALTLLAAFAVLITNRGVIDRQAKLTAVQDALLQAKDRQLTERGRAVANELKAKDIKIGEAAGIAATANERAAKLELDAATQRQRAAIAERQLLQVRESLAARVLTRAEMKALTRALADGATGTIEIRLSDNSREVAAFGLQITEALTASGWSVNGPLVWYSNEPFTGLVILIRDSDHAPIRAKTLQDALTSADIPSAARSVASLNADEVLLVVGPKYVPTP